MREFIWETCYQIKEKIVKTFKAIKHWINQKKKRAGENYRKICHWLNYVRDYESNTEQEKIRDYQLIEKQDEIDLLKKELATQKSSKDELTETVDILQKKINTQKSKYSESIKEINFELDKVTMQLEIKDKLLIKEQKKNVELSKERISLLGTIAAKTKKINNLEDKIIDLDKKHKEELDKKDYTINFYKTNMKAPTLEELKAYEYSRKEVERRQKNGK